jgi:large subunit ribosomal protein L12
MYAAMLLHSAGKEITESTVENILSAADILPDTIRVKALIAALADVDIDEALKSPVLTAPVSSPAVAPAAVEEESEKKPEEEEAKEEEDDLQGLSALFG